MSAIHRYEEEREKVIAHDKKALDSPFIHRGLSMIYHGAAPVEAWREVSIAVALENASLQQRLIDVLNTLPSPAIVVSEVQR